MSLGNIIRRGAENCPDRVALIHKNKRITYKEFNSYVNKLANSFINKNVKKGDRIAVLIHNCADYFIIYYAAAKIGAIFVPINNLLKEKELIDVIEYIEPQIIVYDIDYLNTINKLKDKFVILEYIKLNSSDEDDEDDEDLTLEKLITVGEDIEPDIKIYDEDIATIFLTSGTTGTPKGAMRTHKHNYFNAFAELSELNISNQDIFYIVFPLYHVFAEDHIRHFLRYNTIVIKHEMGFEPEEVLDTITQENITVISLVPTMLYSLLGQDLNNYDLSSLRLIYYAGSPIPFKVLKEAASRINTQFMQSWGQTETGPSALWLSPEDHKLEGDQEKLKKLKSAGKPGFHYEAKIVDQDGIEVGIDQVGELIVRSEAMMIGYWKLPEKTDQVMNKGWLYTGDMCKYDENYYIYIVDRKNDTIISGGKNIYPKEIEDVIYTHESVAEVTVVGVPDEYFVEAVKAIVVLKEGNNATEDEIIKLCKNNLASFKKPRSVEFWDSLPKSNTGKILKRNIVDIYS